MVPPLLHLVPLPRLVSRAPPRPLGRADPAVDDELIVDLVDKVLSASPWPWQTTCLKRGLVLFGLLRRAGRPVDLVLGVRRSPAGALEAHAWLERGGDVRFEPTPSLPASYQPLDRFPGD